MAPRPQKKGEFSMSGLQKAAILMMSIEEEVASKIFSMMSEDEIKEISGAMTSLGNVEQGVVDNLMREFSEELRGGVGVTGDVNSAKKILTKVLGPEKVSELLDDLSGPTGRTTWDRMNNVNEDVLASYIRNEYPQTAALVLTKLRTSQAARVLSVLPEDFALDVIQRMITMEPVKREVLLDVERTLQAEFMTNLSSTKQYDSYEMIAEVFNSFDRNTETKFMTMLDGTDPDSANRIRELMFTFDDLIKIDNQGIQVLLRKADKEKLVIALKGANDDIRNLFFNNMSERASKIMKEDMESKGPVRMKDVDEAQMSIVVIAKELAATGEIIIPEGDEGEEQMVY